jgi:branched-chain amino acid aminotransferase
LEETARLAGFSIEINRAITREQINQILRVTDFPESRLRLTVDLQKIIGQIYLSIEPLITPPDCEYKMGVRTITQEMHRENPKAKLTNFIKTAYSIRKNMDTAINEVLMINAEGQILEGLSSNFFAVIKGEIWTADSGVLSGITRALTLEEAKRVGVTVNLIPPSMERHNEFQEAFITSTSRDVLPVVQIDQFKIANGLPGPISQNLLNQYRARVAAEVELI